MSLPGVSTPETFIHRDYIAAMCPSSVAVYICAALFNCRAQNSHLPDVSDPCPVMTSEYPFPNWVLSPQKPASEGMTSFGKLSTISHIRPQLTFGGGCSSSCIDFDRPSQAQQQPLMGWNYLFGEEELQRNGKRSSSPCQQLPTSHYSFPSQHLQSGGQTPGNSLQSRARTWRVLGLPGLVLIYWFILERVE